MKHRLLLLVLLLWGAMGIANAQTIIVKGTVKDAAGEPVIGAAVIERENPSNGTSTDIDGSFAYPLPKENIYKYRSSAIRPKRSQSLPVGRSR